MVETLLMVLLILGGSIFGAGMIVGFSFWITEKTSLY